MMTFKKQLFILCFLMFEMVFSQKQTFQYAPSFRYSPDRDYDIAWENDLVAFRVYGKPSNPDKGLSGIDAWHKKVSYPILDKWYRQHLNKISYHVDRGEGCDQYHVGKTRGVGGIGLWKNHKIIPSGAYTSWEVISQTSNKLSFKLSYRYQTEEGDILEERIISIKNGSQLFSAKSRFTKNKKPLKNMQVAVGLSTQNGIAKTTLNPKKGWMSSWHKLLKGNGTIGTGVVVDPKQVVKILEQKTDKKDASHVLVILKTNTNGEVEWKAGFAWDRAQKIKTNKEWNSYLDAFSNK